MTRYSAVMSVCPTVHVHMCLIIYSCIAENDMFGEFGEFDLVGSGFGGGMEDIEVARDARTDIMEGDTREGAAGLQVSAILVRL